MWSLTISDPVCSSPGSLYIAPAGGYGRSFVCGCIVPGSAFIVERQWSST
jgi:hypothetical protein